MQPNQFADIIAFLTVAEELSFTRAAARLGLTQSALSHAMRRLEERLKVRLLNRTTRTIALSEAGLKLVVTLRPAFDDIHAAIASLDALRTNPAGTIRITTSSRPAHNFIMPVASQLMRSYPDLNVEISVETRFVDIVAEGFDCGVRLGEAIEKDMIVMKIGSDTSLAVVGSPSYFVTHQKPQTPYDLTDHQCINLRMARLGNFYVWEFERDGKMLNVRVKGQFASNDVSLIVEAAVKGLGLACLPEDEVVTQLQTGELIRVLEDWCPPFPGYHLYYPNRRQHPPAFALFLDTLRQRGVT